MPYAAKPVVGNEEVRRDLRFAFGHPFTEEQLAQAERLEVTHSSFNDPGEDWNFFELYDGKGQKLAAFRQSGY